MSISKSEKYDEDNLLLDRETLAPNIETILGGGPHAPDTLAGLFVELRQAIESGLTGINQTRETLAMGVELAYLHTRAHASAVTLYRLSQEGQLVVQDEPITILRAAIERTEARTIKTSQADDERRRTRKSS